MRFLKILFGFCAWSFFCFSNGALLSAEAVYDAHTSVELVVEKEAVRAGDTFSAGVFFKMDPDWHVYWKNPGDSGMAPRIEWILPEGLSAEEIQWPVPQKIDLPPLTSYGYEGQVLLAAPFQAAPSFTSDRPVILKAKVTWLACKVECVPGRAELEVQVPFDVRSELFEAAAKDYPTREIPWRLRAERFEKKAVLYFDSQNSKAVELSRPYFFSEDETLAKHAENQKWIRRGRYAELEIPLAVNASADLKRLRGVLTGEQGSGSVPGWEVDLPFEAAAVPAEPPLHFYSAVLFAFLGGLILNLMPCVLPVLSLKILSFMNEKDPAPGALGRHGLFFAGGVLVSFWVLAAALMVLRAGGLQIGWGFQLQSPGFVGALGILFFIFALNLFGVFEIGAGLTGAGQSLREKKGWQGSFAGGVLAVIVAAPCTAPFMGTALAFALSQTAATAFAVFTALGFGLALPYLLLCLNPKGLAWLPKPGRWMVTLKKFFGIFMLMTALWLFWILGIQTGLISRLSSVVAPEKNAIVWEKYSETGFQELRARGESVFIDFTAAWCLTCQWNKKMVLQRSSAVKIFTEKKIRALRADWTSHDPEVTRALQGYGRNSIPFYVFYAAGAEEPVFLPELLTPELLKRYLD